MRPCNRQWQQSNNNCYCANIGTGWPTASTGYFGGKTGYTVYT